MGLELQLLFHYVLLSEFFFLLAESKDFVYRNSAISEWLVSVDPVLSTWCELCLALLQRTKHVFKEIGAFPDYWSVGMSDILGQLDLQCHV